MSCDITLWTKYLSLWKNQFVNLDKYTFVSFCVFFSLTSSCRPHILFGGATKFSWYELIWQFSDTKYHVHMKEKFHTLFDHGNFPYGNFLIHQLNTYDQGCYFFLPAIVFTLCCLISTELQVVCSS